MSSSCPSDQDPPPYGPPAGILLVPAVSIFLDQPQPQPQLFIRATPPRTPRFRSSSLQLTPLQGASSVATTSTTSSSGRTPTSIADHTTIPQLPRRRSHTISTPRRPRARGEPTHAPPAAMSAPSSSPPPYSLTPPEVHAPAVAVTKRASSSPHLRLPNTPLSGPPLASHSRSRQAFSEHARAQQRARPTSDEDESGAETDDGVVFGAHRASLADTLRHRLLGKGKGKARAYAYDEHWTRPITTARGAPCAGETETEGEDSPRNLPTARITRSSLARQLQVTLPPTTAWLVPILFQLFRLLAIVPAVFGTLWNLYRVFRPPDESAEARVDYAVSVLWSVLTGWQCLQLTTGLLKRWRVYYSPFATLIRLLALQAICWPATHLTLTILDHAARPLVCWAAIGTTTCCSRSIQLWVTSNIVPARLPPLPPGAPAHLQQEQEQEGAEGDGEEHLRKGRRRRWDWAAVGVKCALPAGLVYFVMAWAVVLRREFLGC